MIIMRGVKKKQGRAELDLGIKKNFKIKQVKEKKVLLSHCQPVLNREGSILTPTLNFKVMTS